MQEFILAQAKVLFPLAWLAQIAGGAVVGHMHGEVVGLVIGALVGYIAGIMFLAPTYAAMQAADEVRQLASASARRAQQQQRRVELEVDDDDEGALGSCPNCTVSGQVGAWCKGPDCRGLYKFTADRST